MLEHAANASRANCQHRIARPRLVQNVVHAGLHGALEHHVFVSRAADGLGEFFSGDALDGLLARRINFGNYQNVRLIERAPKIFPEMLGPGVSVWLKKDQLPFVPAPARGFERGTNLGRVMPVIVY